MSHDHSHHDHDHDHDHDHNHDDDDNQKDQAPQKDPKLVIQEKEKAVTDTISSILVSLNKMDENTQKDIKLVEKEFDDFLQKLKNRKFSLIKQLQSINLDKKDILNKQIGDLNQYKKQLNDAKTTNDVSICNKDISLNTKPIIELDINNDRISRYIAGMGNINNTFPPNPPIISIEEIKAHTSKIVWLAGKFPKYNGFEKASNYVIEIAEGQNIDNDDNDNDDNKQNNLLSFKEIMRRENKRFARLTKLKPSTNYYIRVKCKNKYGWSDYCSPVRFTTYILKIDTKIMTSDEIQMLIDIIKQRRKKQHVRWKLQYRGSEDGFLAKTFHKKCDGVPDTVCVIQSDHGNVFGAFTRLEWKSDVGRYHVDEEAFVFILRKKNKKLSNAKVYLQYTSSQHSVVHNKYMGPVFGYGHDIFIRNKCDQVDDNSCRNHTYQCSYAGELAGKEKYRVINYEVFQIEHDDDIIKEPQNF